MIKKNTLLIIQNLKNYLFNFEGEKLNESFTKDTKYLLVIFIEKYE